MVAMKDEVAETARSCAPVTLLQQAAKLARARMLRLQKPSAANQTEDAADAYQAP